MKKILITAAAAALSAAVLTPTLAFAQDSSSSSSSEEPSSSSSEEPARDNKNSGMDSQGGTPTAVEFDDADDDNDGSLTWAELASVLPTVTEAQFAAADANGDGVLSMTEFKTINVPGSIVGNNGSSDESEAPAAEEPAEGETGDDGGTTQPL